MRLRYVLVLLVMVGTCLAAHRLSARIHDLRTLPTIAPDPAVIAALEAAPMPAQATELGDDLQRLRELQQDDLLAAISDYQNQQRLSEALGMPADQVTTLGQARDWRQSHPGGVEALAQRVLHDALAISLSPAETRPPRAGRSGFSWNMTFTPAGEGLWLADGTAGSLHPYYVFVLDVRNALRLPLTGFSFAVMPRGSQVLSSNPQLPPRSYLWCDVENSFTNGAPIRPGATLPVLCEIRVASAQPVPVEVLQQLVRELRAQGLEPWVRSVELALDDSQRMSSLKVEDLGVSAEFGHRPSARVSAGILARSSNEQGLPKPYQYKTSCAERGDCDRERLVPFEGLVSNLWTALALLLPGYLVAGLSRLRQSETHGFAGLCFVLLAVIAVPMTFSAMGGGYGPLVAALILGYAAIAYWIGYPLGRWALRE